MDKDNFELSVEVVRKTEKAIYIDDGTVKAWVPLSMVKTEDEIELGKTITITIPQWLATDKGFI